MKSAFDGSRIGHTNSVTTIVFSPDSKLAATSSYDGSVKVWDVGSQTQRETMHGIAGDELGYQVVFLRDGRGVVLSGHWDERLCICTEDGIVSALPVAESWSSIRLLAGGMALLSDEDGTLALLDISTGQQPRVFPGTYGNIQHAALSADGAMLAVSYDENLILVDVRQGVQRWRASFASYWERLSLSFSPDGVLLACASASSIDPPFVVDAATGKRLHTLSDVGSGHSCHALVVFSPDRRTLATAGDDGIICLWDVASGGLLRKVTASGVFTTHFNSESASNDPRPAAHRGWIRTIEFSPNGKILASAGDDYAIKLWNPQSGAQIGELGKLRNEVRAVAMTRDGKHIVAGYEDGSCRLWGVGKQVPTGIGFAHSSAIEGLALSATQAITTSGDGAVKVWDLPQLRLRKSFDVPAGSARSVAVSSDGLWAALGGSRMIDGGKAGDVTVWDLETYTQRATLEGWGDVPIRTCGGWWGVNAIALSPDDSTLATAVNEEVHLWDLRGGRMARRFRTDDDANLGITLSLAFSRDGGTLAVGTVGAIVLFDTTTGVLRRIRTPRDCMNSLSFSPDGRTLAASTDYDDLVWLHDVATGEVVGTLCGHTNSVRSVTYGDDGALMVTGGADGYVKTWRDGQLMMTMTAD